ncbi:MAG TPA: histidine kinase [Chthoniobacterales bacterium]|jgi:signal transduction histidine kinase
MNVISKRILPFDPSFAFITANYALAEMLGYASVAELMEVKLGTGIYFDEEERERLIQKCEARQELRALLLRLSRAREEERIHVSREVHEELGQWLTGLKMDLRWMERKLSESGGPPAFNPLLDRVVGASALADTIIAVVQKIAAELRSSALDALGLEPALHAEVRRFQKRSGVRCTVIAQEMRTVVSPQIANELFYICRKR